MKKYFLSTNCQPEALEGDLYKQDFFTTSYRHCEERSNLFLGTSNRTSMKIQWRRSIQQIGLLLGFSCLIVFSASAQLMKPKETYTHADTLRGSLNPNRDWWDVLRYDITVKPDYEKKEIEGSVIISFKSNFLTKETMVAIKQKKMSAKKYMQIDLQSPLIVDSVINSYTTKVLAMTKAKGCIEQQVVKRNVFKFSQVGSICLIEFSSIGSHVENDKLTISYHGKPKEAKNAPWDGGWIWKKDKNGNPWMSVAVQGLGASAWYPCKDYQGDEPDNGASLTMIVPDTLVAVANGRLTKKQTTPNTQHQTTYSWEVKNPINNYNIIPYIGKYVNFTDTLMGEKGKLDLSYWVLDYNLDKAKEQFKQVKPMLHAFEYWFGPYPFYEDSYKLVESPHLGMEHQSAVAYGNQFKNGYLGRDLSSSGWGLKWDFIIVHESGHEWFGNNITSNDIADMWIHESFTNYSETLFTEYYYGIQAGNEYNYGLRKVIKNDIPIIGPYGVNKEGSGDMYPKGANMIHSIRHAINDDKKFRQILRGLNKTFYHKTVNAKDIQDYISKQAGLNFQKVFDQYLLTTQIPVLEYHFDKEGRINFVYSNCIKGFNLPLVNKYIKLNPTDQWQQVTIPANEKGLIVPEDFEKLFYIKVKKVEVAEGN